MTGKHSIVKYKVRRKGDWWIVVFAANNKQVPGTPSYESKKDAQRHADQLPE